MRFMAAIGVALLFAVSSVHAADELKVGDPAPEFSLKASDGQTYKLSDYRDKQVVVLAWYPKAFTSGCTVECKSLAEKGDLIRKYDVSYFMASVDAVDKNKDFAKEYNAKFPLLSDESKEVAKSYGVLNMFRVASRWTFYIGKDGKILAIDKQVNPETSAEDIAARLAELGVEKSSASGE
jgi:thioredoxin-dependent peroxiredoxin